MNPYTIPLICFALFALGCEQKMEPKNGVNRVTEVKFGTIDEKGKEGWMKLEIFMELDSSNPIYPIGVPNNLKSEKLRLHITRTEHGEDRYYAEFRYLPSESEDLKEIHMEDLLWSPHIGFNTIKLKSPGRQIQSE
jgi:hypothetical protein